MKQRIGFVGIGAMGAGMVTNLRKNGFPVTFYARDTAHGREAAARLERTGAQRATDLASMAKNSDAVILCLPDSPTVEAILSPDAGVVTNLATGGLVIDCTTSHPESTRKLAAQLAQRGLVLLDAPLTGSRVQAEAGTVSVLGAGPRDAFERARPIFEGFAGKIFHLGESGAGHATKLINNFFGQLALAGICETWPLLARYGIEPQAMFVAISASGGNSATFQAMFPKLQKRDFSLNFAQALARKDIRYLNELEHAAQAPAPVASALLAVHDRATKEGFGARDITSLLEFYEQLARTDNAGR